MEYKKLVRDKIPEVIRKNGKIPVTHIASEEEYWGKLKEKLSEEVKEFLESESEEEIADISEVLSGICSHKKFDKGKIELLRKKKLLERGGFDKRIILDEAN